MDIHSAIGRVRYLVILAKTDELKPICLLYFFSIESLGVTLRNFEILAPF